MSFDLNEYKPELARLVKLKTGRDLAIDGELTLKVSLAPTVRVEGVRLGNAQWSDTPVMLSVERFEARAGLIALLSRRLDIKRLVLIGATIEVEKDRDGKGNWVLGQSTAVESNIAPTPEKSADIPSFDLSEVEIRNVLIRYRPEPGVTLKEYQVKKILAHGSGADAPLDVEIELDYDGAPSYWTDASTHCLDR
jgi:AsmA protein